MEPPSQITSPLVRGLFAYWNRIRAGRMAPRWSEVDPGEIRPLLPYLMISEVLHDPFDIRYRIVGSAVVAAYGYDFTWSTLRALRGEHREGPWLDTYRRIVGRRGPCFGQYRIATWLSEHRVVDTGSFPLSGDGVTVDRLIELEDWEAAGAFKPGQSEPRPVDFIILPEAPRIQGVPPD